MINKTSMFLSNPLREQFLILALKQNEIWAEMLVKQLRNQLGDNPELMSLTIDEENAYAIESELQSGIEVNIDVLLRSLSNWREQHKAIPLLLMREDKSILLPHKSQLQIGDRILFASDYESQKEIELIASNIYELHYVMYGKEKKSEFLTSIFGKNG